MRTPTGSGAGRLAVAALLLAVGRAGAPLAGAEPAKGPGGAIFGRVTKGDSAVSAIVEARRVGAPGTFARGAVVPYETESNAVSEAWATTGVAAGLPAATVHAGEDGRYRLAGLAAGDYQLRAVVTAAPPGYALASVWVDGAVEEIPVAIPGGSALLSGRLVRQDGKPFRGSVVVTQDALGKSATPFLHGALVVEADEEGRFAATGLDPGEAEVAAVEVGRSRRRIDHIPVPTAEPIALAIDRGETQVSGRVLDASDGHPLAGATVRLLHKEDNHRSFSWERLETGPDGRFAGRAGKGQVVASATASGHVQRFVWLDENEREGAALRLYPAARVVGRVVAAADGHALAGVTVYAETRWLEDQVAIPGPVATDGEGGFVLGGLPPGECEVRVHGGGWMSLGTEGMSLDGWDPLAWSLEPGSTTTVELRAEPAAAVRGRLLARDGSPVVGALVGLGRIDPPWGWAATDDLGGFLLPTARPGRRVWVVVAGPGIAEGSKREVLAGQAGSTTDVVLRLPLAVSIRIRVVDAKSGAPVGKALVAVAGEEGATPVGPDGNAVLGPFSPRALRLEAAAVGFLQASTSVEEADLESYTEKPLVIRLEKDPAETPPGKTAAPTPASPPAPPPLPRDQVVRGRVVAPPGMPLEGASLSHGEADEPPIGAWKSGPEGTRVAIQSDGTFEAPGLERDALYGFRAFLRAGERRFAASATARAGTRDLVLILVPAIGVDPAPVEPPGDATWAITVLDPEGRPVPRGEVRYRVRKTASGDQPESLTEWLSGGRWTHRGSSAFELSVLICEVKDDAGTALPLGPWQSDWLAPDAGRGDVEARLPREESIAGVVRAPDGSPERGVLVIAHRPDGDDPVESGSRRRARTDSEGRFRVGGLGERTYALEFRVRFAHARMDRVLVRAGVMDITVDLHEAVRPRVVVVDPDGHPLSGIVVAIEDADTGTTDDNDGGARFGGEGGVERTTDAGGAVTFDRLDPGREYLLVVDPRRRDPAAPDAAAREEILGVRRLTWRPKEHETLRLERALHVRGVVHDARDEALAGARVLVRPAEGSRFEVAATADAQGRFDVGRLHAGEVEVVALAAGAAEPTAADEARAVRVPAGASDVVLTVPAKR